MSILDKYEDEIISLYKSDKGAPQIVFELQLPVTARSLQRWLKKRGLIRTRAEAFALSESRRVLTIQNKWKDYRAVFKRKLLSPAKRFRIMTRDNNRCKLCGANASSGVWLEVDHIVPVHEGGSNEDTNLQTLCKECNVGKYHSSLGHK